MGTRRHFLLFAVVCVVLGIAALPLSPRDHVTPENAGRISIGMRTHEVEAVLKRRADVRFRYDQSCASFAAGPRPAWELSWAGDQWDIVVQIGPDGLVMAK